MIEFNNVNKSYALDGQCFSALKNINLSIPKASIFGLIGESGAGKSTFLRCINALETPNSGEVLIGGQNIHALTKKDLAKARQNIGCLFQQFHLFSSYTVFDNIAFPLRLQNVQESEIQVRVNELLSFVELQDKEQAYPAQLSGGQQQRVAIARALASNPSVLLLDEPTSALDPKTTESVLQLIQNIQKKFKITLIIITHELNVIETICTHAAYLNKGELIESGEKKSFLQRPQNLMTKRFLNPNARKCA